MEFQEAGKAGWVGGHQPPKTQKMLQLPTGNYYFYPSFPNNIINTTIIFLKHAAAMSRNGEFEEDGKAGWVGGHQPQVGRVGKTQKILQLPTGNYYFYPSFPNNIINTTMIPLGQP